MNNRNTLENDIDTRQRKRNFDFGTGLPWIMDCGMHGILMSIFTDFSAFKSSLLIVTGIIFGLGSIRQVRDQ